MSNPFEDLAKALERIEAKMQANEPTPETLLSRVETAELLGITLNTLKKFTRDTTIPAYGIGSRVFYKRNEVLASLTKIN
ncbi:helix-turn-helix domain-containing protein [Flavobacterium sp. LB2P74]|uniref:helix-turn-helix domain-containing protein n=1 Tax=Flavobacterium sp. LB2P74 TaxID=3401717 RepID=UPI003AACA97C